MANPANADQSAVAGGEVVGIPTLGQAAQALLGTLSPRPAVAAEAAKLPVEMARILLGRSEVAPEARDRRFADPAWSQNPVFRRLAQTYVAGGAALTRLVDDLEANGIEKRQLERARFASNLAIAACAPTNLILTNPAGLKRAFDTSGASLIRGLGHFIDDVRHNGGFPTTVDRSKFEVGRNLAVSTGSVVDRDEMAELIHYAPTTASVHKRPLLIIPPPIGRFYFLDLSPGRSFVEFAASRGQQPFMMSWRNPGPVQGDWGMDDYAARVSRAIDTVLEITGQTDVNVTGFCAGGIITTTLLNQMATVSDDRIHSMSYGVTLLDFEANAPIGAFNNRRLLGFVRKRSSQAGVITSRQMGTAFTLMRPDDLVFNYVVSNYILGDTPPAYDILAWNADGTNLPGKLHTQFLDLFRYNSLVTGEGLTVMNTPVDLRRIKIPTFVTGALTDHLTPWKGCYRTTQMLGGESTFVLSYSGHIASLVNPPGNPRAHYWSGGDPGPDPDQWHASAQRHTGSWWEAWSTWLTDYAGPRVTARKRLGSKRYPPIEPAPGRYVRARPAS